VAEGNDDKALYSIGLNAISETWITDCPNLPFECTCKIRYRQPDVECTIYREKENLRVMFKKPVAAVAPGQSVVFYDGPDCLGGAVIDSHIKD
jgi:tRNA-specific 2-thiouridylase